MVAPNENEYPPKNGLHETAPIPPRTRRRSFNQATQFEGVNIMNMLFRSLAVAGIVAVVNLGFGTSDAHAQAYSVNVSVPGFSMGVGGGVTSYYSTSVPAVSVVTPSPVVVGSSAMVYAPYYAPTTYVVPRTYYYSTPSIGFSAGWYLPVHYGLLW
jgi:hypothetical protein